MADVNVNNRSFKTIEELRSAIIRKHMIDKQAVIFAGPKAMAEFNSKMKDAIVIGKGIWENWPQVVAVRIDGVLRSFERTADGDKMHFYELDS